MGKFGMPNSYCLIFDLVKRKVAITQHNYCSVQDINYLREWQLHWTEKSVGGTLLRSDPYLRVGTSDLELATLKVEARSVEQGHEWDRQLSILMGK